MKLIFTKILSLGLLLILTSSLTAQEDINVLRVVSPASIAGDYDIFAGTFGSNLVETPEFAGDLLLIEDAEDPTSDACTEAVNDLTGFIAFIDRGSCAFVDKAANAVAAGAVAVLICNNLPGDPIFAPGGDAPDIMVPVAMASFEDCQTIRAEFGGTVSATFGYNEPEPCDADCFTFDYPSTTVWGAGREGDFVCDLGDWITVGLTAEENVWTWAREGRSVGGWANTLPMTNESACNGSAIMDYSEYNTTGATGEYWTSELISPTMDLSAVDNPILNFTSANLPLNSPFLGTLGARSSAFWSYSLDNGTTWQDTFLLESQNIWNADETNLIDGVVDERFIIQEAANVATVRVKFIGAGDFYYWMVDNVYITDEFLPDVEAFVGWYSGAPNFKTPQSQVDEVAFMIDANNIGNVDFDDVSFTATVSKDGAVLHTAESGSLGPIPAQTNVENFVVPETWPMTADLGQYEIGYTVSATGTEADVNADNDVVSKVFMVTENTFSKLRTEAEAGSLYMNGLGQNAVYVTYANGYYITNGDFYLPTSLNTGFETDIYTDFGFTTLTGEVREWIVDANNDGIANLETETRLVARGQVLLDPDNPVDLRDITIDMTEFPEASFQPVGQYLAMVHVAPLTPPTEDTFMAPLSSGFVDDNNGNKDYFFAATDFAFEQLGITLGRPSSLSDFAGGAGTPTDQGARNLDPADGSALSWNIAMEIQFISNTVEVDETIGFDIFPNPATNFFNVDLKLEDVADNVNVQIVDLSGKVISNSDFTNVKDDTLRINTENISAGVYVVNVFTETGVRSERIFIQK